MHYKGRSSLGLLALGIATATQVWAQDAGQIETGTAVRTLDEIVVTARRRDESSQAVPVSVTALGAMQIEEKGIVDLKDLTNLSPGLRVVTTGGGVNADISMRGLKRVPIGDGAPAVVVYMADVPLPYSATIVPTFDLENIQVLKGPQGTLFGRNTLGGAVVLTPAKPDFDGVNGYAKASIGNYNSSIVEGAVNLPVNDTLAVRLAYQKQHADGYVKNLGVGNDLNDVNNENFRASVLWEPIPELSNLTVIDYMDAHETGTASVIDQNANNPLNLFSLVFNIPQAGIDQLVAAQKDRGMYKIVYGQEPIVDRRFWGISNKTEWDMNDAVTVRNILGYREAKSFVLQDTDGTPLPVFDANSLDHSSQLSNELQFLGNAMDGKLDWIVGAFYLESEPEGPSGTQFSVGVPAPWNATFGYRENKALFGQIGYDLGDLVEGLKLNLGLRNTWDEAEVCAFTEAVAVRRSDVGPGDCPSSARADTDGEESTWTFGLDYQLNDSVFLYGVTRRGYREGGLNTPNFDGTVFAPFQSYEPELITDYEVGVKTDWMLGDAVGRYNLSVFRTDYEDIQALVNVQAYRAILAQQQLPVPPNPGYGSLNVNGGETTIDGIESELVLEPTDNLQLSWLVNYLHQSIDKQAVAPFPGTSAPEITSPTPRWSSTASLRYAYPLDALETDLVVNADVYWSDKYVVGVWEADSYSVTNLRISLDGIQGSGFGLALFGRNLFDEEYWSAGASTTPSIGVFTGQVGAPRMYGLEANYKFGL